MTLGVWLLELVKDSEEKRARKGRQEPHSVMGARAAQSALGGEGERKRQLTSDGDECEG
jgi:hypothetical protein